MNADNPVTGNNNGDGIGGIGIGSSTYGFFIGYILGELLIAKGLAIRDLEQGLPNLFLEVAAPTSALAAAPTVGFSWPQAILSMPFISMWRV